MRPNTHTCTQREKTTGRTYCTQKHNGNVTVRNDGKGGSEREMTLMVGADKYKMINPVNPFLALRNYCYFSLTAFCL